MSLAVPECAVVKSPRTVNELLPELLFEVFDLMDLDYSRVFRWCQVCASSLVNVAVRHLKARNLVPPFLGRPQELVTPRCMSA